MDIVIEFHKKMSDWGGQVPQDAGRLVRAKLTLKRLVMKLCRLGLCFVALSKAQQIKSH